MSVLSITLFGSLTVTVDGQPVNQFEYNKVRALLAYLVTESGSPHRREGLAGLLWPDQSQTAALNSLRNALSTLRQAIGDNRADPAYLLINRDSLQFNISSDHWLDVSRFSQLLAVNQTHRHRRIESCWGCTDRLTETVNIYKGEFLQDFHLADSDLFEDWAALKREHFSKLALQALQQLTSTYAWRGDYSKALTYVQRQLDIDPYREDAHQSAMKMLASLGMRAEACAQYEKCKAGLAEEVGVEPADETTRLYDQIKYGAFLPVPSSQAIHHNNLPAYLTSFVGRKQELDELSALLEDPACRLLTLVGPGGAGKTRLAVAAAGLQHSTFTNGVCFTGLANITSPAFIIPAILQALELKQAEQGELLDQLVSYLSDKELLLILDNFEQLIEGAGLINDILKRCRGVVILVTSRQCLDLQSEWLFELNGLSYPHEPASSDLRGYEAIQLFTERLHQVKPRKTIVNGDLADMAHVCQLVEGLPLGIELAVASIRQQTIDQVASSIETNLNLLASSWRDVPEEHRSLQAVFENSWRLLSAEQQSGFQGLSVFQGGFTPDAALHVTGATPQILEALVKHSLLRYYPQRNRYIMLEMLRQYAWKKLAGSGLEPTIRQAHLDYYISLAEQCYTTYHETLLWSDLNQLVPERDNCRAALEECFSTGQLDSAMQLAGALGDYWLHFGYATEAENWISRILESGTTFKRDHLLARALLISGFLTKNRDLAAGKELEELALAIWVEIGDYENVAVALLNLYYFPLLEGDYELAITMLEHALDIFKRLDNQVRIAATMNDLSDVYMIFDKRYLEQARQLSEQALEIDRRIGRTSAIHWDLKLLGHLEMHQGNYQKARLRFEEAIAQVTDPENAIELSDVYRALGLACYHLGDYAAARKNFELRLKTTRTSNFGYRDISTLCELTYLLGRQGEYEHALFHIKEVFHQIDGGGDTGLAIIKGSLEKVPGVLLMCGEPERCAILFGFTDALRERQKVVLTSYRLIDIDRDVAQLKLLLGEPAFTTLWEEGRNMSFEQARRCVLEAQVRLEEKIQG